MDNPIFQHFSIWENACALYKSQHQLSNASHPRRALDVLQIDDVSALSAVDILLTTFYSYGSLFFAYFFLFLILRNLYRNAYNVNDSVEEHRTPISSNFHGRLSWIWKVFQVSDEEIFEHCGMDAIVFIRCLRYGLNVAYVGMFTSVFLIPVYVTSCTSSDMAELEAQGRFCLGRGPNGDIAETATLGAIPDGKYHLLAPVVAAYIVFGRALYLILQEFSWYTEYRHRHLALARPDNYTVYVKHIPSDMRSDEALREYFSLIFSETDVLDARVAVSAPELDKMVAERKAIVPKLEHAINIYNVHGVRPRHIPIVPKVSPSLVKSLDSIEAYTSDLESLNKKITSTIDRIEEKKLHESVLGTLSERSPSPSPSIASVRSKDELESSFYSFFMGPVTPVLVRSLEKGNEKETMKNDPTTEIPIKRVNSFSKITNLASKSTKSVATLATSVAGNGITAATNAVSGLLKSEDEKFMNAGFVSFRTLLARQSAIQMIHHEKPFIMEVEEAPLPKDVFWRNVGIEHKAELVGFMIGNALTIALCLFWTILTAFVSSLGKVQSLTKLIPFLGDLIVQHRWVGQLLAQVEPLLLVALAGMLSTILLNFSRREGLVSESHLQASLFQKLSIFLIIQFFFCEIGIRFNF
mmetsp:Transcript_6130/g.13220  ORF Transcript_6130/g.13220 Transcript_6130/m.13220 type:complete len:639 (-) Transcript_6130:1149-3065(-)